MSIQKHLNSSPYLRHLKQNPTFQYRVRNLSKNHSMKQLTTNNTSKKDVLSRINNKYTLETSFFSKQNINNLQVQSEQDLPKYILQNPKKENQKPIKRNNSHRVLRKVSSCQLLPPSLQTIPNQTSLKNSFMRNEPRKVSLKRRVEFIKKKHNQDKSSILEQHITQVQSEQFLVDKKKSKPKLKLLVRDPFQSTKHNDRRKVQLFQESKIEPVNNTSMMSETNRQQFEEFLSCLH